MNYTVGIDIEGVDRFEKLLAEGNENFFKKIFTQREIAYCNAQPTPAQHFGARFAGKEAIVKAAAQLGITITDMKTLEILNDNHGVPYTIIKNENNITVSLSLTHTGSVAAAIVLLSHEQ